MNVRRFEGYKRILKNVNCEKLRKEFWKGKLESFN
jgi:hypothetical protein